MTLYTDIDQHCCDVLAARVADGRLPAGEVRCADVHDIGEDLGEFEHIHLFAGIGGMALGFARAGWPAEWTLITGGFPCQDISTAGKGAGLDGERSGLYWEMLRIVAERKPLGVCAENVGALSARGLGIVANSMRAVGYEVAAVRVGGWAVASPQIRERWFILAHAVRHGRSARRIPGCPRPEENERTQSVESANGTLGPVPAAWPPRPEAVGEIPAMADRIPDRLAGRARRIRAIGNAVVPQVVAVVARAMIDAINSQTRGAA